MIECPSLFLSSLPKAFAYHAGDDVRVHVGGRTTILKVPVAILLSGTGDTARSTTVGDTIRELVHGSGFVLAGQTTLVTLAVGGNVFGVTGTELLEGVDDDGEATGLAHGLGGEVGVAPGAVPVGIRQDRKMGNDVNDAG